MKNMGASARDAKEALKLESWDDAKALLACGLKEKKGEEEWKEVGDVFVITDPSTGWCEFDVVTEVDGKWVVTNRCEALDPKEGLGNQEMYFFKRGERRFKAYKLEWA